MDQRQTLLNYMLDSILPEVLFGLSALIFFIAISIVIPALISDRSRSKKALPSSYKESGK